MIRRAIPRAALVAALIVAGLTASARTARAGDFSASGEFTVTSAHGNRFEIALGGRSHPGGAFTGVGSGKAVANGNVQYGVIVFDYGDGDTLTFDVRTEYDPETGLLVGTYVVTGGTGQLEGATGSGSCIFLGQPVGGTGPFEFDGTLSF